jgi:hypothetical protein
MNTPTLPATLPFLISVFPIKQEDFLQTVRQDGGSSRDLGRFVRAFVFCEDHRSWSASLCNLFRILQFPLLGLKTLLSFPENNVNITKCLGVSEKKQSTATVWIQLIKQMGVSSLMLFIAPLCNRIRGNKLSLTAIVVPINIYCDKYKLMNTVCQYTIQCVGTQYSVSVHNTMCQYTIQCVSTQCSVSVRNKTK